eukprot:scaffold188744_cov30-Tisochrysis_lutea.AAC.2
MFGNLVLVVWPPPDSNVPPCSSASIRREKAGFITEWWKSWMTQAPCRPPSSELRAAVSAAYSSKTASERGPCLTDPIHLCVTLHVSPQTSRRFMSASNRFSALSHCRCRYFLTASMISSAHNSRNGTMGRSSHQSGSTASLVARYDIPRARTEPAAPAAIGPPSAATAVTDFAALKPPKLSEPINASLRSFNHEYISSSHSSNAELAMISARKVLPEPEGPVKCSTQSLHVVRGVKPIYESSALRT